MYVQDLSRI